MKKTQLTAATLAGAMAASGAWALDDVTIQLKWVTQAQFAGYYVALENGYFEEEGLNVTIRPGGPDIAPPQVIAGGGADVIVEWMPAALAAREAGLPLVNIAQRPGARGRHRPGQCRRRKLGLVHCCLRVGRPPAGRGLHRPRCEGCQKVTRRSSAAHTP